MKYSAQIGGSGWAVGPADEFATVAEARAWAESFGKSADWCRISDETGTVALHRRDQNGDGTDWYDAEIDQ